MTARVLVFATIAPEKATEFEAAYKQVTKRMAGTPGLISDELLRDADGAGRYVLLAEWESEEHFRAWEDAPIHREITVPMRPYWSGRFERKIYNLAARMEEDTESLSEQLAGHDTALV